jgi:tRNA pseudouridine65 synthase
MQIHYEDSYLLVINKPPNLLVHHSKYARNIEEKSLVELLIDMGIKAYPIHRLDRKTSGLILFAKQKEDVALFQALFEIKQIEKKYIALVRGFVVGEGVLNSPVKNDRGNYKEAETKYTCLEQFELPIPVVPYASSRYSLVEFSPSTGRMHQLRIHSNKMSHPIIGDPKYGNRHHNHMFEEKFGITSLFLHAYSLKFNHPITKNNLFFQVSLPGFWEELTQKAGFESKLIKELSSVNL